MLKLDPDAARKRKEAASGEAHVRRFREDSGNAGMIARELPSDEVLAGWQHVEQRALDLRAAGMGGSLQDLRVRAYLDLLQERDSRALPAGPATVGEPAQTSLPRTANHLAPAGTAAPVALTIPCAFCVGSQLIAPGCCQPSPIDKNERRMAPSVTIS